MWSKGEWTFDGVAEKLENAATACKEKKGVPAVLVVDNVSKLWSEDSKIAKALQLKAKKWADSGGSAGAPLYGVPLQSVFDVLVCLCVCAGVASSSAVCCLN